MHVVQPQGGMFIPRHDLEPRRPNRDRLRQAGWQVVRVVCSLCYERARLNQGVDLSVPGQTRVLEVADG